MTVRYLTADKLAVENGARWLDETVPGWRASVNLEHLDLNSGCNCVAGQIFGSYWRLVPEAWNRQYGEIYGTRRSLRVTITEAQAIGLGFTVPASGTLEGTKAHMRRLESAWVDYLAD